MTLVAKKKYKERVGYMKLNHKEVESAKLSYEPIKPNSLGFMGVNIFYFIGSYLCSFRDMFVIEHAILNLKKAIECGCVKSVDAYSEHCFKILKTTGHLSQKRRRYYMQQIIKLELSLGYKRY